MEEQLKAYLSENFGKEAKDSITGFIGKITGTALYAGGYQSVELSTSFDCKLHIEWFDINRIELTGN